MYMKIKKKDVIELAYIGIGVFLLALITGPHHTAILTIILILANIVRD